MHIFVSFGQELPADHWSRQVHSCALHGVSPYVVCLMYVYVKYIKTFLTAWIFLIPCYGLRCTEPFRM